MILRGWVYRVRTRHGKPAVKWRGSTQPRRRKCRGRVGEKCAECVVERCIALTSRRTPIAKAAERRPSYGQEG